MSVLWYLMAKGKGGGGYKTASGPIVSVNDALAAPLRSLLVNIDPVQEGSGDPSPDNVRPISGWSGCKVWRTGKNLFDGNFRKGYYGADGVYYATPSATTNAANTTPILVKAGARYFFATERANGNSILWYDKDMTLISANTNAPGNVEIEAPENAAFLNFKSNVSNFDSAKASINYPSTDTPYEPYSGNQYTLQLGQTVYGGTLDVTNGVLTVDRAYKQLTKNDSFSIGTSNTFNRIACGFYESAGKLNGTFVCDSCVTMPNSSGGYGSAEWQIWGSLAAPRCWISVPTTISTVADFKTYLETNPVGIVYELATPITIPLTPQEISTLQGANNVWADCGDVTVEYLSAGGANPDLMKLAVAFMGRK